MTLLSNIKSKLLIVLSLASFSLTSAAQQEAETPDNTLNRQFQELKESSNNYQEYEVIKVVELNAFWQNVQDSLAQQRQQIQETQNRVTAQQQDITRLSGEVETRDRSLEEGEYEKAHLKVLGMDVEKESFVLFFWVVLAVLLAVIGIILYKHRYSQQFAAKKNSEYLALENEFTDYKNRAREKETRLMRDLQTERNANEELSQRLASRGK